MSDDYIVEYPNVFSHEFCDSIIEEQQKQKDKYADIIYWKDKDINKEWSYLIPLLHQKVIPYADKYFEKFDSMVSHSDIQLSGIAVIRQPIGAFDGYHYDTPIVVNKESVRIRPFVCLLYLNDDFEGGQLVFPAQKRVIQPEKGKILFFPSTFMYPHFVAGIVKGERSFVRLNYMFDETANDQDLDQWNIETEGSQHKGY